jgi:hypothetical protein
MTDSILTVSKVICPIKLKRMVEEKRTVDASDFATIANGKIESMQGVCKICINYARRIIGECKNIKNPEFNFMPDLKGKHKFYVEEEKIKEYLIIPCRFMFSSNKKDKPYMYRNYYLDSNPNTVLKRIEKEEKKYIMKNVAKNQKKLEGVDENEKKTRSDN